MNSTATIHLTRTTEEDLDQLFLFQQDPEGIRLAAFTPTNPDDQEAYRLKYARFLSDPTIHMRTIRLEDQIVGSLAKFIMHDEAEITYWIDRPFWGQGIATRALRSFLQLESTRPLYGRVAFDNLGSQRVLERCGFVRIGTDRGFANARQAEIEEYIYELTT